MILAVNALQNIFQSHNPPQNTRGRMHTHARARARARAVLRLKKHRELLFHALYNK